MYHNNGGRVLKLRFRVSQTWGYLFGCPHDKDYNIMRSILVFPQLWKLQNVQSVEAVQLYKGRIVQNEVKIAETLAGGLTWCVCGVFVGGPAE